MTTMEEVDGREVHDVLVYLRRLNVELKGRLQRALEKRLKLEPLLKEDRRFMLEAVEHHPELYLEAAGEAKVDPVIMATAFAGSPNLAERVMTELHLRGEDDKIQSFLDFLLSQLSPLETFVECILGSMLSTHSVEDTGTNLTLLNQGLETSMKYKRLLAEYLGLPTGKCLCRLQQAESNVRKATTSWAEAENATE
jgi:hypothetical protein